MSDTNAHKRTIRSFVRRAGRITPSQQRAFDTLWPVYGVEYDPELLAFEQLFGRSAPVVLEIGFGNGETLVEQAAANPDKNFIGIEVHEPGIGHCMLKADEAGVTNLRLINHDAIEVLTHQVPRYSLSRLNLYFPDPWPKKRHHKRRIITPQFLALVADRLASDGTIAAGSSLTSAPMLAQPSPESPRSQLRMARTRARMATASTCPLPADSTAPRGWSA